MVEGEVSRVLDQMLQAGLGGQLVINIPSVVVASDDEDVEHVCPAPGPWFCPKKRAGEGPCRRVARHKGRCRHRGAWEAIEVDLIGEPIPLTVDEQLPVGEGKVIDIDGTRFIAIHVAPPAPVDPPVDEARDVPETSGEHIPPGLSDQVSLVMSRGLRDVALLDRVRQTIGQVSPQLRHGVFKKDKAAVAGTIRKAAAAMLALAVQVEAGEK